MGQLLRRIRNHLIALSSIEAEDAADPKAQLEQAIADAQEQHRQLRDQAANVIGNQRQTELRLAEAVKELEKLKASARQAVMMADLATREGDGAKAAELTRAAEGFANRMVATEEEVSTLEALHEETSRAAERARRAVDQNAAALQAKLAERQRLLSQLDQATMQEQVNRAMDQLSQSVEGGTSTMDQVRDEIEARYTRALAEAEVRGRFEAQSLELEQARMDSEAQMRLDRIRSQLGLGSGAEAPEPPAG
ncbi:MAG: PspA/IM30 family protein [Acidimicrobiales bacterium]|nr:PspA/IM30 family protein [Acidimicrobiales bacterium]